MATKKRGSVTASRKSRASLKAKVAGLRASGAKIRARKGESKLAAAKRAIRGAKAVGESTALQSMRGRAAHVTMGEKKRTGRALKAHATMRSRKAQQAGSATPNGRTGAIKQVGVNKGNSAARKPVTGESRRATKAQSLPMGPSLKGKRPAGAPISHSERAKKAWATMRAKGTVPQRQKKAIAAQHPNAGGTGTKGILSGKRSAAAHKAHGTRRAKASGIGIIRPKSGGSFRIKRIKSLG